MKPITLAGVAGTVIWAASAVKMLGYVWEAYTQSYDKSAFQIGGSGQGTGAHDTPIIPPVKRKRKPNGKKTRLPRLRPIPAIPPLVGVRGVTGPQPIPEPPPVSTGSPWGDLLGPDFTPELP